MSAVFAHSPSLSSSSISSSLSSFPKPPSFAPCPKSSSLRDATEIVLMETIIESNGRVEGEEEEEVQGERGFDDPDGTWLVLKKGEILAVETPLSVTKWRGMVLQNETSGYFNPKTCRTLNPSSIKLTDNQICALMRLSYQRSISPPGLEGASAASAPLSAFNPAASSTSSSSSSSTSSSSLPLSSSSSSSPLPLPSSSSSSSLPLPLPLPPALSSSLSLSLLPSASSPSTSRSGSPLLQSPPARFRSLSPSTPTSSYISTSLPGSPTFEPRGHQRSARVLAGSGSSLSSPASASFPSLSLIQKSQPHVPRLEVWDPRPNSPALLRSAWSESNLASSKLNRTAGSSGEELQEVRPAHRTNSLIFFEEEEEEDEDQDEDGEKKKKERKQRDPEDEDELPLKTIPTRRASADLIQELVAERRRKEGLPQESRSSSLPNQFKKASSLPVLSRGLHGSASASNLALVTSAIKRLQATEGLSQEVLDRKARALERTEFAKNKKQQMLTRRHSSPNFDLPTGEPFLSAITEVTEPEPVAVEAAAPESADPLTSSPSMEFSPDSPKLGKRFQRRANSMGLGSTLDGIDEMDEESKEALRRRSISEGTYAALKASGAGAGPKRKVSEETDKGLKRKSLSNIFKGLRKFGSKTKLGEK